MTHLEAAAVRAVGIEGWEPCIFEAVVNGSLIHGGIPRDVKGKKKWPAKKHLTAVVITEADVQAEYARYEAETGNCGECYGKGQRVVGWHYIDGSRYKPCTKCGTTGKAVNTLSGATVGHAGR